MRKLDDNPGLAKETVTKEMIVAGLRELGIKEGDGFLVHSSLSSFGYVAGGADTVIDAMLEAVGPEGTVLVPTLTGRREDGPDDPPIFDVRHSPCWTGRIPSEFMKRPEARRSLHPTHSVSGIGPSVPDLIAGHEHSTTPCGKETPYYRLAQRGGYILLIGVGQGSNTTIHTAEELAGVPYHMQKVPTDTVIIDYDGNRHMERLYLHDWGTPRRFERIDEELLNLGIMRMGKVGASTLRLIKSLPMIEFLVEKLRNDPHYLCQ
ncbi:MAG TPA: AAC(3) family N-acetyltransferase [Firmicutes bacterium]|nr:AAC(3) family N-acetyltransferase [Bacillota bacterium]